MGDPRRRRLLYAGAAALILLLTVLRGPVVLAAAGAVVLAVAGYRVLEVTRPNRTEWSWGRRGDSAVEYEGRMSALAALVDPEARDPDSPARLQRWFRHVGGARATASGASSDLARYLAGPPRRLTPAEVHHLLTELDRP